MELVKPKPPTKEEISQREFARRIGVSKTAVRKALDENRDVQGVTPSRFLVQDKDGNFSHFLVPAGWKKETNDDQNPNEKPSSQFPDSSREVPNTSLNSDLRENPSISKNEFKNFVGNSVANKTLDVVFDTITGKADWLLNFIAANKDEIMPLLVLGGFALLGSTIDRENRPRGAIVAGVSGVATYFVAKKVSQKSTNNNDDAISDAANNLKDPKITDIKTKNKLPI